MEFSTEKNYYLTFDGTQSLSGTNTDERSSGNINIFAGTRAGNIGYFARMKLYQLQIEVSNTLVRDFIPVSSSKGNCMFDRVTEKLFCNEGTGEFLTD